MSRIPAHTLETAPAESAPELEALQKQFGKVLNIFGGMSHSPVVLQMYVAMQQVIGDYGTFDAKTREVVALAVGSADECAYCQAAHTGGGKAAGLTDDQIHQIRTGHVEYDSKVAALVNLARECTLNVGHVKDETWQAALDAGWSDTELTELFANIGVNLFTNYFNHFVQTDLDLPKAPDLT